MPVGQSQMPRFVLIPLDGGVEGTPIPVEGSLSIGRSVGDLCFPDDPFMSGSHATVRSVRGQLVIEDHGSTNGTFLRIQGEVELRPGDEVKMGSQLFRFTI